MVSLRKFYKMNYTVIIGGHWTVDGIIYYTLSDACIIMCYTVHGTITIINAFSISAVVEE